MQSHKLTPWTYLSLAFLFIISACSNPSSPPVTESKDSANVKIFERVPSSKSGIRFNNEIVEDQRYNHIFVDIYQGAGLAVGDINNDGLPDVYMAGNLAADRLYLNEGGMKFKDISAKARIGLEGKWSTGVAMADVNGDGWLDIYVCKFLMKDPKQRENLLYINNGDLTFTESAKAAGVADQGYSTMANFFDYDKDGHLDLYVGNEPPADRKSRTSFGGQVDYTYTDRLFHNNGDGTFTDVTQPSGILNFSFTLSVTVSDIDNDGWPDIYVACDYEEPDKLYRNNGDGTFTNILDNAMRHISTFSMGADVADINNDGWMDICTADMVAADNQRLKANMSGMNPEKFWALANAGYHYQYMFNTMQINNGNGTFSEIGQMAGMSNTDWSWATLLMDYDNDGWKDLFIANGVPKDIRNNDYIRRRKVVLDSLADIQRAQGLKPQVDVNKLIALAPSKRLKNYIFQNNKDLTFVDRTDNWGLDTPTWSQGAAYADFDQDGDLDLVINNMNDEALLYENKTQDLKLNNYFRLKLEGDQPIGSRAWIYYGDNEMQVQDLSPVRGYFSQCEAVLHFGMGATPTIDRLKVLWPDGRVTEKTNVAVNQVLTLKQKNAGQAQTVANASTTESILKGQDAANAGLDFQHTENQFDDFAREILLPHRMSNLGPALAKADVNGDGIEDVFFGGASGQAGKVYFQQADGSFVGQSNNVFQADQLSEDVGAIFFDANGDGASDLYVSSGGNDFQAGATSLQDRLYLNDGKGNFRKGRLPRMLSSSAQASAGDYDGDGDLDLFVGGRQIPGKYGVDPRSYILRNDKGNFVDVTAEIAPQLGKVGMVTDAVWSDFDGDKDVDLIVVGEWMPLSFFRNEEGQLENVTAQLSLDQTTGWWNTITAADFDGDGDEDYIIGNLGLNIKYKASEDEPFRVYAKDFDGNGSHDVYLAYYDKDGVCYPVRGRECSSQQLPFIKKEFKTYNAFSVATVDEVLGERKDGAVEKEVKLFTSVYLENRGDDLFVIKALPNEAQISPIFVALPFDWNGDGHLDVLTAGNYYEREVETTRSDAGIGCLLLGDGQGNFRALKPWESGLASYKDVRSGCILFDQKKNPKVVLANNNDRPDLYTK